MIDTMPFPGIEPLPGVAYDRETWGRLWLNARLNDIEERIVRVRQRVVALVVAGQIEEAVVLWEEQLDLWAAMLTPIRQRLIGGDDG